MIKYTIVGILLCSFLFTFSNAAEVSWKITPPGTSSYVGILSDPWVVSVLDPQSLFTSTVSLSLSTSDGSAQFFPDTLNFGSSDQSLSFRLIPQTPSVTVTFTSSDSTYVVPLDVLIVSVLRTITIDAVPGTLYVSLPSEPLKITLEYPPSQGPLTLTPSTTTNITFAPSSVEIPVGSNSGSFVVTPLGPFANSVVFLSWTLSGEEAGLYQNGTIGISFVQAIKRPIYTVFPASVLVGDNSTVLYVWTNDRVNDTVTITPSATDTIFTPSQLDLTPNVSQIAFTINTTSPVGGTNHYYIIDGPGAADYTTVVDTSFTAPLKTVTVVSQQIFVLNKKGQVSLRIAAPVVSSLQVFLFAANMVFNPTNVTFTGSTTSVVVDAIPFASGVDSISFTLAGDDVEYYNEPTVVSGISIVVGQFSTWYTPSLWIGFESDSIPVRVNIAPEHDVTLTLFSPDVTFNPPTLTFTPGVLQQYFTITPNFTGTASTDGTVSSSSINFLVGGTDWASYAVPDVLPITAQRRTIQTVWAPHLTDTSGVLQLYLQKTYIVWIVANHVTDPFTVTPVNPYFTFDPPFIQFSSSVKHTTFRATVNGVVGQTTISYLIGGTHGGLYQNVDDDIVNTDFRPLSIINAVISPDNRVPGVLVYAPSALALSSNHIYAFELQSSIIPDSSLTITPRSDHITFSPSSITLNNADLVGLPQAKNIYYDNLLFIVNNTQVLANFSTTPLASGQHEVWFQLSGADAPYYIVPPHTTLSFLLEERVATELPKIISSSSRLMSSAYSMTAIVIVLLSLFHILM